MSPWGGWSCARTARACSTCSPSAPDGSTSLFARNHRNDSEFTGATFSPDRHTLFVNIQEPGMTFAITGPFARIRRH